MKSKQQKMVLNYMNTHGSITSIDAFRDLMVTRLSAVIYELKRKGFVIDSKIEAHTNNDGDTKYFARYRIVNNDNATV